MRKRGISDRSFLGQLLFAEVIGRTVTLDCVLSVEGEGGSGPATFVVAFPPGRRSPERAAEMLEGWADELAAINVRMVEGKDGTEVQIASGSARLVLQPDVTTH